MTTTALPTALDPATIRRTVLPNGLRVLVRQDRSAPVVAIVTYVSAGYFDEADEGGGRLPERRDDLRSHELLRSAAVIRLRAGAGCAVRCIRQLADRRRG